MQRKAVCASKWDESSRAGSETPASPEFRDCCLLTWLLWLKVEGLKQHRSERWLGPGFLGLGCL